MVDEAARRTVKSLESLRDLCGRTGCGLVLLGMSGLPKRPSRYAQFSSRIGFVHEFRPLSAEQVRESLGLGWSPPGATLPSAEPLTEEVVGAIIWITRENSRLLPRWLTQTERILKTNQVSVVRIDVVKAARESLVIGEG